ncbi:MAG: transposase [Desulfobacterales bacterium]|nr:transposase [Desulfobacterales bacterium]
MEFNDNIHNRRSIRLKNYDYSKSGLYFITICTQNKLNLFGQIKNNEMILNEYGRIVYDEWIKSAEIRNEIELDKFVIMPNHFHGIVMIYRDCKFKGDQPVAPTKICGPKKKSIGSLISGYKSSVTKKINILRNTPGINVWQRNYYEHIIRNDDIYNKIAEYIMYNPITWQEDKYFA